MEKVIKTGSKVKYRGCFGTDKPVIAVVEHIERSKYKRDKYGDEVPEIPFSENSLTISHSRQAAKLRHAIRCIGMSFSSTCAALETL